MKPNFKIAVIVFTILLLGCQYRFLDDTRLLVKGDVENHEGNPIPDAEIKVYTQRGSGYFLYPAPSYEKFCLGSDFSDTNGDFSVISLYDQDEDFAIEIYKNDQYTSYYYTNNTEDYIPDDFTINLGTVTLHPKATFNFKIERTSGLGNELHYAFEYTSDYCLEVYDKAVLNNQQSQCYKNEIFSRVLNDDYPNESSGVNTLLGSSIVFIYSINGQPEEQQIIAVNSVNQEFNFTY
ncbi:hypothetical protein [Neotamlana nanhaiensis]|nr:hypothetical protein [Tamlana nanhaiensis]